jgi:acetyl/propionyl-CoA carboxylase alpha subunit
VIDAGLIWIGPPSAAIDSLGNKVKAGHVPIRRGGIVIRVGCGYCGRSVSMIIKG